MNIRHTKLVFPLIVLLGLTMILSSTALGKIRNKIEKSFAASSGGMLSLETDRGDVDISIGNNSQIEVSIQLEANTNDEDKAEDIFDDFHVEFAEDGNELIIDAEYDGKRGSWLFWSKDNRRLRVKFFIKIPEKFDVSVITSGGDVFVDQLDGKANVHTSGGDITLENMSGSVRVKTSGGDISLAGCSGMADVKTSGGDINIGSVEGEVVAVTSGGDIIVDEVMGTIDARTSGGDVTARITTQPNDDCRLTTSGGNITVYLDPDLGFDLNAKTSGGRVRNSFKVKFDGRVSKRSINAEINDGGPELYLRTSGGDVRLKEI
ncbi:MAG: DUF4097 domain-containing protein [FCB group bacterium]|nr:DUF4097 domain-containing protein [FCB group bacterium]